ncbi:MAG: HNH/ENDO VII family nuclease [Streptococcus parasanguinis]|nr:HNH/ENDO VII family nuclease [Streptococcus parasanguinis]
METTRRFIVSIDKMSLSDLKETVPKKDVSSSSFNPKQRLEVNNEASAKLNDISHYEKTPLRRSDKQELISETGWSKNIVDNMRWKEEASVYKDSNLVEKDVNGRPCFQRTDIDYNAKDDFGKTNKERKLDGKAPLADGKPVELHHIGQRQDSPLAELTFNEHKSNFSSLHEVPPQLSQIDRGEFRKEKAEYWRMRGEEL